MRLILGPLFAVLVAVAAAGAPLEAQAHGAGSAFIIVPADHINPGSPFDVIGADLGPNAAVSFEIVNGDRVATLGDVSSDSEGHFQANLQLPADYPQGYAELFATSSNGTEVATWVLVGPRTEATGAPPRQSPWWMDPSVIVLGIFLVGAILVIGYVLLRPDSARPAPAPAARRPLPSKRRRARMG